MLRTKLASDATSATTLTVLYRHGMIRLTARTTKNRTKKNRFPAHSPLWSDDRRQKNPKPPPATDNGPTLACQRTDAVDWDTARPATRTQAQGPSACSESNVSQPDQKVFSKMRFHFASGAVLYNRMVSVCSATPALGRFRLQGVLRRAVRQVRANGQCQRYPSIRTTNTGGKTTCAVSNSTSANTVVIWLE